MKFTRKKFNKILEKSRGIIKDKSLDECSCTQKCEWHGKCFECINIHRTKKKHIPECLQPIFEEKLNALAQCIERKIEDDRPEITD
ncbi:MAG: hypothetical protein KKC75_01220 [Nanoarchaeota archaeon]|nr:hypothetical protein [Nanoarchaeota archaeon]MBU1004425.1 hypothetical protein [Nanoarchaeota archaeon]MBU1946688.1 hypothetical protein [Nanoarchaeota archaeon]